ncbi:hypothetical protein B4N89_29885 [Embleya scabrispora]|uniref:Uncharacterized protein n=1 Tax=Embleya scabrispora TaxID=159449 RepID=A0A1T3P680_9ACTN|nr:hypothetical protein [Embleya scabrispora]OPC84574.1 hypothetical protein B4N89_29885 [Embleya scabrispora]
MTTSTPTTVRGALAFDVRTEPDRVRVSRPGQDSYVTVTAAVSAAASGGAHVAEFGVRVPIGTTSAHLSSDVGSIKPSVDRAGWLLVESGQGTFAFAHENGGEHLPQGAGVIVTLDGVKVNAAVGMAEITLETFDVDASARFMIAKLPEAFALTDFRAAEDVIGSGDTAELTWRSSSVTQLQLLYDDVMVDVTGRERIDVAGVRHTTVFYLRGSSGAAWTTLSKIVSVHDPDIRVNDLTVTGTLTTGRLESRVAHGVRFAAASTPESDTARRPFAEAAGETEPS